MTITDTLNKVIDTAGNKTLKAGKEALKDIPLIGYKSKAINSNLESAVKSKTKADFIKYVEGIVICIGNAKSPTPSRKKVPDNTANEAKLMSLAVTINKELESAQQSFFTVGNCLVDALDHFKANDGNQSDFIKWADHNCGIKKAQAYKLMKVYKTFGDNSEFAGVSMRVLYTLTAQSQEIVDSARVLAISGKLDTGSLNDLLEPEIKPEPITPVKLGTPAVNGSDKDSKEVKELKKALEISQRETADAKKVPQIVQQEESKAVASLNSTIEELNSTIKSLRKELSAKADKSQSLKPASLPYLPQFDSVEMSTRLGLEIANSKSKTKINKAYRALATLYTLATSPKAAQQLKEARETLLNSKNLVN